MTSHVTEGVLVHPHCKAQPMLPIKVNSQLLVSNGVYPLLSNVIQWLHLSNATW